MSNPRNGRISGFTLIELLVVISILALLVALLLPALGGARQAAQQAECMARMKQISMYSFQYAGDHKEWLPSPNAWDVSGGSSSLVYNRQITSYIDSSLNAFSATTKNYFTCAGSEYYIPIPLSSPVMYNFTAIQNGWRVTQFLPTGFFGYGPWFTEPTNHHPKRTKVLDSTLGLNLEVFSASAERIGRYSYWGSIRYSHPGSGGLGTTNLMFGDGHAANMAYDLGAQNGITWNWSSTAIH